MPTSLMLLLGLLLLVIMVLFVSLAVASFTLTRCKELTCTGSNADLINGVREMMVKVRKLNSKEHALATLAKHTNVVSLVYSGKPTWKLIDNHVVKINGKDVYVEVHYSRKLV